jgi:flagellar biogenesis protein FliO
MPPFIRQSFTIALFSVLWMLASLDRCAAQNTSLAGNGYPAPEPTQPRSPQPVQAGFQVPVDAFPELVVPDQADVSSSGAALQDGFAAPVVTTVSSLLVVLAIFGGLVWISRRYGSSRAPAGELPEDVLGKLGSTAIDSKTRVTFLKVSDRILVIGQTLSGDPQTLSEISDPEEVRRITDRCLGRPEIVGRRTALRSGLESSRRDLSAG